jgi:membrane protein implicated in regulation of membrane protease activity
MAHFPPLRIDVAILLLILVAGVLLMAVVRMRRRRRRPPSGIRVDLVGAAGEADRRPGG